MWCWRRLFRVPWTAKRSNQSTLKEISPEYSLEGCWSWGSNTLATWYKELTHWKRPWCWERLKAGGEGDDRGWDGWMASPMDMSLSKLWELVKDREACCVEVHGVEKNQTWLIDWTTNNKDILSLTAAVEGIFFFFFLAAPGGIRDLLVAARGIWSCSLPTLSCGMWDLVPWPGIEPGPPFIGSSES